MTNVSLERNIWYDAACTRFKKMCSHKGVKPLYGNDNSVRLSEGVLTQFKFVCKDIGRSLHGQLKTYSEQILEPSQVYEFRSISKAHIENMIISFHTVLVHVMHSLNSYIWF
jgi:hypothetical protein